MHYPKRSKWIVGVARHQRRNPSLPEKLLWKRLKSSANKEFPIKRQHPILDRYVVDYFYEGLQIAFEIDGRGIHQFQTAEDAERQKAIEATGVVFVRIPASWVLRNPDEVAEFILNICSGEISLEDIDDSML